MRLRIDLSYDGRDFHGWATQPGLRTVQGEITGALQTVLRTPDIELTVAGRTDTGVHARGQVAHVDIDEDVIDAAHQTRRTSGHSRSPESATDALTRRLNGVLDPDVRIRRVGPAPDGFDARFSAQWRRYCYRIADRAVAIDPLTRGHVLTWPRALDEGWMNQAAQSLMGEADFASFCKKREGATTIRTLVDLHWQRNDAHVLEATVRADAFCHNMVRSLVGCLITIGEGRRPVEWASAVLRARVRDSAVGVVPAHGLTLEEIGYPADHELAEQARRSRVVRTLAP